MSRAASFCLLATAAVSRHAATPVVQCYHGHFHDGVGGCVACPAGKFRKVLPPWDEDYSAARGCSSCMPGTYQDEEGAIDCKDCAPGTYTTAFALPTACGACPLGKWTTAHRAEVCLCCTAGTYGDSPNHCAACPAGRSTAVGDCRGAASGEGGCELLACPIGKFGDASTRFSTTAINLCFNCPAGQHGSKTGGGAGGDGDSFTIEGFGMSAGCTACAAGTYQPLYGQARCLACPAGMHQYATGAIHCAPDAPPMQASAVNCPGGKYAEDSAIVSSVPPAQRPAVDHTQHDTHVSNRACYDCPRGKWSPFGRLAMACTECEPGTFESGEGSVGCAACPAGKHQERSGRAYCDFDAAEPTAAKELSQHQPCKKGFYVSPASPSWLDATAAAECLPCGPGRYGVRLPGPSDDEDAACAVCALGRFTPLEHGSTSCAPCKAGTFGVEIMGVSSCQVCPAGKYQHQPGSTHCFEPRACSHTRCRFVHKSTHYVAGTTHRDRHWGFSVATPLAQPAPHAVIVFSHSDEAHGDHHACTHERAHDRSFMCRCSCW